MAVRPPVYMIAAECGAMPGGKAGGIGDVLRDLPPAIARRGRPVTVLMPSYGRLHQAPNMSYCGQFGVDFAGAPVTIRWYGGPLMPEVEVVVLDAPGFDPHGSGSIYHDDGPDRPFATDATRFALLCAAAGRWLVLHAADDGILHLHDWHAALLPLLATRHPGYVDLQGHQMVLTLHNLALQGLRPRRRDAASIATWFPELDPDDELLHDPRYPDVANPLAAGIRLADAVNTVSPTNAREIVQPDDPARGFHGGEGLHDLLREAAAERRLHGILNGCDYRNIPTRQSVDELRDAIQTSLADWSRAYPHNAPLFSQARRNLEAAAPEPDIILTAVSRLTDQKAGLLLARDGDGRSLLSRLLGTLPGNALLVVLGSGDPRIEADLARHAAADRRLVFLRGFSESLADTVYASGDLFLMPSTFEPCGISQMLAMRAGQPCLVHAVGGLNDTVIDGNNGFSFAGDTVAAQMDACQAALIRAQQCFFDRPQQWQRLVANARAARFDWESAAAQYCELLYG